MEEIIVNEINPFNDLLISLLENIENIMQIMTYLLMATPILIILGIIITSIDFKDLI